MRMSDLSTRENVEDMNLSSELVSYGIEDNYREFGIVLDECPICVREDEDAVSGTVEEILKESIDIEKALRESTNVVGAEYVLNNLELVEIEHTENYRDGCIWDLYYEVPVVRVGANG